jgi:hypothetical protein
MTNRNLIKNEIYCNEFMMIFVNNKISWQGTLRHLAAICEQGVMRNRANWFSGFASLAHLVERLNCNQEGRGFDSFSWHHTSLNGRTLPLRLLFFDVVVLQYENTGCT